MAKNSAKYEILYIINATLGEDETKAIVEKFKAMVEENGTLTGIDEWGKRRLAYPINDMPEGYYVLMNVTCTKEAQAELDRYMRNDENVVRQMIIKK